MINERKVKRICKDYTKIENYEEAVKDTTQTWHCHHILGEILSRQQLKDHDFYYDVPPCMLKFVTGTEHKRLHMKGENNPLFGKHLSEETKKKMSEAKKGRTFTEEHRRKMSEARKGENHPLFGHHHSEESRRKISEAKKGKHHSEETKKKMSDVAKNRWKNKKEASLCQH